MAGEVLKRDRMLRLSDMADRETMTDPLAAARGVVTGCALVLAVIALGAMLIAL